MLGLSPSEQRQMFRDIKEVKELLKMRGPVSQYVEIEDAEIIAGCKKRKLQRLVAEGKINVSRTGKKTQYNRLDLEKYRLDNSTLRV